MENEETLVVLNPTTSDIIKEAAIKAAAGAIVYVVVTQLATYLLSKGMKRFKKTNVIETTAN